jgi:hypothetical protein
VKSDAHWPTLAEAEQALLDEVTAVAPLWPSRMLRKVLGSRTIREVAERDPELVRRAFLIGARHRGTVPMRLWWVAECPHWKRAADELAEERAAGGQKPTDGEPAETAAAAAPPSGRPAPAPAQRQIPAAPTPEYLAAKQAAADRAAADRAAAEHELELRSARHAEVLADMGVTA